MDVDLKDIHQENEALLARSKKLSYVVYAMSGLVLLMLLHYHLVTMDGSLKSLAERCFWTALSRRHRRRSLTAYDFPSTSLLLTFTHWLAIQRGSKKTREQIGFSLVIIISDIIAIIGLVLAEGRADLPS